MKKALILSVMAVFAIGMFQNVQAQAREKNQQQSTQASESVSGASKVETNTQTTQTVPPRRIGQRPSPIGSQNIGKAIKSGQDIKGDARVNAMNGRTGKRVSAQTNTTNPEAQKPGVKTDSNNSNSGNSGNSNSDKKTKGAGSERPQKSH